MKKGLGRGLDALFADLEGNEKPERVQTLRISDIEPNREQPRKVFDEEKLAELAESIQENGLLQPVVVRPLANGRYQIIAGERRWRAGRLAGLSELPVIIMELSDDKAMEIALIENLQREDLSPLEEANGYRTLMDKYALTQEEVARRVSKSRPAVANAIRLLNLPEEILHMLSEGSLSSGHARALLAIEDKQRALEAARRIVSDGLTVREAERLAKEKPSPKPGTKQREDSGIPAELIHEMEKELEESLGRRVRIKAARHKGRIELEYYSEEDLEKLLERLKNDRI